MSNATNIKAYRITNHSTGADLGTYEGADPADALSAMAIDAGYPGGYAQLCDAVPAPEGGLRVTEVEAEEDEPESEEELVERINAAINDQAGREFNARFRLSEAGVDPAVQPEEVCAAVPGVGPLMAATLCRQARRSAAEGYIPD